MNDTETNAGKTSAENPSDAGKAQSDLELTSAIERTLPNVGSAGSGSGEAQPFSKPPGRPGRPRKPDHLLKEPRRKNRPADFSEPPGLENAPAEMAGEIEAEETLTREDAEECGRILSDVHCGFYEAKGETVVSEARRKLPSATVDAIASKLVVSDRTRENLAKGYADIAEAIKLSPKVARGIGFISSVRSLHTQQMAAYQEIRDLLAKLPDKEPTAEQTGVAMQIKSGGLNA